MSKKNEALGPSPNVPLEAPLAAPISFAVGEKVRFCPVNGDKDQDAEILALPGSGSSKYLCLMEFGSQLPINACYLKKL